MPTNLANHWVLITGASSGFGAAAATGFAQAQANLLLGARRIERLAAVATAARKAGAPQAHYHFLDVARTDSVEAFFAWVKERTSQLDVLVNNAGGAHGMDPVHCAQDADWEAMVQSNFLGVLRVTRAALPLMTNQPGGLIINIGSVAGHTAYEGGAAYCGCKAAELQVSRALRLELCSTGTRVCTIDPGLAETEFSLVRFKGDVEKAKKVYAGMQPLTAADIADIILWVATRPAHVCIDELIVKPTAQATVYKVHRLATP